MKKFTPAAGRRHTPLGETRLAAVAELFGVLCEPSRLRILEVLRDGPVSVGDLVNQCRLKQANVSKQLGILHAAGIIARRQEGNRAIYSIDMPLVFELCEIVCRGVAKQADRRAKALKG